MEIGMLERLPVTATLLAGEPPPAGDAGDDPLAADEQQPLADHLLRVEAAEHAEREQTVLADVGDRDPDLVDVADDHEGRSALPCPHAGERAPERVARHRCEGSGRLAPDGRGGPLMPRGPDGGEEL